MALNILAVSAAQYQLDPADRKALLASIPPEICFPNGIVPTEIVEQYTKLFPNLKNRTRLPLLEMKQIMHAEVANQQAVFVEKYGSIFG